MSHPGVDGVLGTRASLMLGVVFLAMFAVIPALGWSVWLVKRRRNYGLYKWVQIVLLATVALVEVDMRSIPWKWRAEQSPYYPGAILTLF